MQIGLGLGAGGGKPIRDIVAAVQAFGGDIYEQMKLQRPDCGVFFGAAALRLAGWNYP
ncbi:hypothetical protein [Cypionkella sp.]|uniref:hypothetical protein n=1 Tax=Cypionkella sp. TaxID=2811411 RepID=UPI00260F6465|nr:hypothetical protein [Cypionkella sp.]MDB5664260.1 hypothetical protein [Cypionkella sp.]